MIPSGRARASVIERYGISDTEADERDTDAHGDSIALAEQPAT